MKDLIFHSRSFSWAALSIVSAASLAGCATTGVTRSQRVDGARVSYAVAGSGSPVVVLESGLGDGKATWSTIVSRLGEDTTVFSYDRPGYAPGFGSNRFRSDKDGRRTGQEVAAHLHDLLDAAGIEPPYVLVGHSIGGPYVLTFAKLYPEDVAGIVLVDGRPADFTAACEAADVGMCKPPGLMVAMMPAHQRLEVKGIDETESFTPRPRDLGDFPITVIAATEPQITSSRALQDLWLEHQKAFADGAKNGRYVEATGSSHYVHQKKPGLVADEIKKMLNAVRSAPSRP